MMIKKKFQVVLGELLDELTAVADEKQVKIKYSNKINKDHSFDTWLIKYNINEILYYKEIIAYSNLTDYKSIEITETAINKRNNTIHVLTNFSIKFHDNQDGEISL
jgi:hypothetical protein